MDPEKTEKKTKLKRRGEVEIPAVVGNTPAVHLVGRRWVVDTLVLVLNPGLCPPDQPEDSPQLYILLFGFYQPLLIAALDALGVHVSTVIRLCSEDPEQEERCQGDAHSQTTGEPSHRSPDCGCRGRFFIVFSASPRNEGGAGQKVGSVLV